MRRLIQLVSSAFLLMVLCIGCLAPASAGADGKAGEVIRVGYPISKGLCEIDENGVYSGYTYEYLQEIAQFTGWEYEFVQLSGTQNEVLGQMYDMLEKGELDLMGSTNYSAALDEIYDYPSLHYGSVSATLEVLAENTAINEENYQTTPNLRVAVLEKAKNGIAAMQQFCSANNMTPELVLCANEAELLDALHEQRADMLLLNDAAAIEGTRIVARFNPKPFYFATTAGKSELVAKLNSAMFMLNDSDPAFSGVLYEKYFARRRDTLLLSDDEKKYLAAAPVLRVGVADDRLPLEDVNEDGSVTGVSADLLAMITAETGLQFQMVPVANTQQLLEGLHAGTVDLAAGITYDYNDAQNYRFSLTKPYLSTQIIMAVRDGENPYAMGGKRLALPRGMAYDGDYTGEIIAYDSIRQCLQAIRDGDADYCYGNGYSIEYYCSLYRYRNITLIPQSSMIDQYCIGVARPANPMLLTILNKTIRNLPQGEMQAMIYRNSAPSDAGVSLKDLIEDHPFGTFLTVAAFALLLIALFAYIAFSQRRARHAAQVENKRYQLLSELSGEFLFEYDFEYDRLTMSERTVRAFGGEPVQNHLYRRLVSAKNEYSEWMLPLLELLKKERSAVVERQVLLPDGRTTWLRITVVTVKDAAGHLNSAVGKITDIQAEKEEMDELSIKAQTDGLTGLYNAVTAREMIERALGKGGTMLMMDVDQFKSINDRFGHYTGDQILQNVAALLRKVFRDEDIIGRLGGDEFIVFLRGVSQKTVVEERCRKLREELSLCSAAWTVQVTISIGAAVADSGSDYAMLYRRADDALYNVKAVGRNGFHIMDT